MAAALDTVAGQSVGPKSVRQRRHAQLCRSMAEEKARALFMTNDTSWDLFNDRKVALDKELAREEAAAVAKLEKEEAEEKAMELKASAAQEEVERLKKELQKMNEELAASRRRVDELRQQSLVEKQK